MEYRTPRILLGTNEDGEPWYGPQDPRPWPIIEITETEYVYRSPEVPAQDDGDGSGG